MPDDYVDWRDGFDNQGKRTTYDEEGNPHYEYNQVYDNSRQQATGGGARRGYSEGVGGALAGVVWTIVGWVFLKLPIVLVGLLAAYGVWNQTGAQWWIAAAVGLAAFAAALFLIDRFARLVRRSRGVASLPLRLFEFVIVAGIQFVVVFAFIFSIAMPQSVRSDLVEQQARHFSLQDLSSRVDGVDTGALRSQLQTGQISSDTYLKQLSEGISGVNMLYLFVESQKVYATSMASVVRGGASLRVWIGILLPLVLALLAARIVYRMHVARYE